MSTLFAKIAAMLRPYVFRIAKALWALCFKMIIDALEEVLMGKLAEARRQGDGYFGAQTA